MTMMPIDIIKTEMTGVALDSLLGKLKNKFAKKAAKKVAEKTAKEAAKQAAKAAAVPILTKVGIIVGGAAYWVCLTVALGGVIAYMIGYKKGIRATAASVIVYIFIEAIV